MGYSNDAMTSVSDAADGMFFECTKQLRAMKIDDKGITRIADVQRFKNWKASVSCFLTDVNRCIEIASFSEVFSFLCRLLMIQHNIVHSVGIAFKRQAILCGRVCT